MSDLATTAPEGPDDINAFLDAAEADAPETDDLDLEVEGADQVDEDPAEVDEPEPEPDVTEPAGSEQWLAKQDPEVQSVIQKLREENASRRVANRDLAAAFEPLHADDRAFILDTVAKIASDPATARDQLVQIVNALDGVEQPEAPPAAMSPADIQRMVDERVERARMADQIDSQARSLGYEPGTDDYKMLLLTAAEIHNGDLEAAHKAFESRSSKAVADFVAKKSKAAKASPKPTPLAGGPGTQQKNPAEMSNDEFRRGLADYLDAASQ